VPEPSLRERARKFARRHDRLVSTTTLGAAAAVVILVFAALSASRQHRLAEAEARGREDRSRLEAREALAGSRQDVKPAQFHLFKQPRDRGGTEGGERACRRALGRFQALENPSWQDLPLARSLSDEERHELSQGVEELLFLLNRASVRQQ